MSTTAKPTTARSTALDRPAFKVRDLELADFGRKEIRLAEQEMPGLMAIRAEYRGKHPLKGAKIMGIPNLPGRVASDASALYARNLFAFAGLFLTKEGAFAPDYEDEILKAALVTQGGAIVHPSLKG